MSDSITQATWASAGATILVAIVAIFQDQIRAWLRRPRLRAFIKTEPPDCVWVPFTDQNGKIVSDCLYLCLRIENSGKVTAKRAEVYAQRLRRKRPDGTWEIEQMVPPMNLVWSHRQPDETHIESIAPDSFRHCALGHIVDPAKRNVMPGKESPGLGLNTQQTNLVFDLMAQPNHKGHIVGPGEYRLDIVIAADNAPTVKQCVNVTLTGKWYASGSRMLRDGVGVTVD